MDLDGEDVLPGPRFIDRMLLIEGVMQHENRDSHLGWSERHLKVGGDLKPDNYVNEASCNLFSFFLFFFFSFFLLFI